ncbi:MAG: tetratricopeptide repeat protein, partial [Planctomycetes bacterium]|nr:tetratricopeptide repeat protein [Planctomycetota bacterium]
MRTAIAAAVLLMTCPALAGRLTAAETIKGRVADVSNDAVKIKTEGEWLPAVDDPVEIYFEMPGVPEGATVAEGKVSAVAADAVTVKTDRTFTAVERNHLVRITSEKPQRRPPAGEKAPPGGQSLAIGSAVVTVPTKPVPSAGSAMGDNVTQLLAKGHELCTQGKLAEAQQIYGQAVQLQPNNPDTHYALATALNFSGNFDAAIAAYQAVLRVSPQTPEIRAWIAQVYLHKGEYASAIQWANQEIAGNPKSAFAHSLAGSAFLETGDAANRDRAFAAAVAVDPGIADVRHRHGNVFYNHRQPRRALTDFGSAAYMAPKASGPVLGAGL